MDNQGTPSRTAPEGVTPSIEERRGRRRTPSVVRPRGPRRRKYWRRHTLHYYIVLAGIAAAIAVCILNTWGFFSRSLLLSAIAFAAVGITDLIISSAFFWGFFMIMNGNIPTHRLKYLIPHAMVGTLTPLLYTLNISLGLDNAGRHPIGVLELATSFACLLLLGVQFTMGKAVVHREPLRIVRSED